MSRLVVLVCLVLLVIVSADNCRCVFNGGVSAAQKLAALNYVCANLDCSPIQQNGTCFYPDTIESHSLWAIDAWFQANRNQPSVSCDFSGTAHILCETCVCDFVANATNTQMKDAMTYVCGNFDCSPIMPGGSHYLPNTLTAHASWAVNAWYQAHLWTYEGCQFDFATVLNPEDCRFSKKRIV
eukprot:TRINITY_DN1408_c0_g1_i3.p1 TRINITY_DN1408_c0_g1~~TRINITY_DN1408_c0_g1_i3.p1  ORF type:complete len:183 (-),score=5.27 TRINITY_DN1408_c0_g1_i3:55-603(-)